MDQKKEQPRTPRIACAKVDWIVSERQIESVPRTAKRGQILVPKWYSLLMTIGWKRPMMRKVDIAMSRPSNEITAKN